VVCNAIAVHTTSISFWGMRFQEVARNVRSINLHAFGLAAGAALSARDYRIRSNRPSERYPKGPIDQLGSSLVPLPPPELRQLRFDHFKVPVQVIFGDLTDLGTSELTPRGVISVAAMFASCILASAIFHCMGAYPYAANIEAPTLAFLSGSIIVVILPR
jgi:hypothetical protein